jgi:hypothetical protein
MIPMHENPCMPKISQIQCQNPTPHVMQFEISKNSTFCAITREMPINLSLPLSSNHLQNLSKQLGRWHFEGKEYLHSGNFFRRHSKRWLFYVYGEELYAVCLLIFTFFCIAQISPFQPNSSPPPCCWWWTFLG